MNLPRDKSLYRKLHNEDKTDDAPEAGSTNPVKSGGVHTALSGVNTALSTKAGPHTFQKYADIATNFIFTVPSTNYADITLGGTTYFEAVLPTAGTYLVLTRMAFQLTYGANGNPGGWWTRWVDPDNNNTVYANTEQMNKHGFLVGTAQTNWSVPWAGIWGHSTQHEVITTTSDNQKIRLQTKDDPPANGSFNAATEPIQISFRGPDQSNSLFTLKLA